MAESKVCSVHFFSLRHRSLKVPLRPESIGIFTEDRFVPVQSPEIDPNYRSTWDVVTFYHGTLLW